MTKIVKWYAKMSVWKAILGIITPLTIGGEVAVYASGVHPVFHWVVLIAAIVAGVIKYTFTDNDNNGIADQFENK